jgi:hypothetical protein
MDHLDEMARAGRTAMQVARSALSPCLLRSAVGAAEETPGASVAKTGSRSRTASSGPPIIRQ